MAEVLVGGALLSGFLNVLFDRLASQEVLNLLQRKKGVSKLLKELEIKLRSANKLLNDAEVKQLTDEDVKKWLDDVKDVVYEADHVMDKINTKALRCKVEEDKQSGSKAKKLFKFRPKLYSAFNNTIKSEIEEILGTLDLLLAQKDELGLREGVHQNRPQRLPAPLVDACDVYGRDAEKEAIVELLLSDHNGGRKLSVIPIVGMGGIGKTTLAQLVYNDSRVQDHFALKVWVTVSEEFDVLNLTRKIIEVITSQKCDIQDLYQLQTALKKEVMGKRFLFVLDDVWNENYDLWDALRSPFDFGENGSKILVTTRSKIVASKMSTVQAHTLQMIPDDDCWKLFARHAFDNKGSGVHPDFQEMGKEIVKKCKGLPLAIKSIAGVLRSLSSLEEWRGILRSDVWDLQFQENKKNEILPALWLSYQFLPPNLKRCFAYCSIFPKDYEFWEHDKETIVLLWMAEGLLQPDKGKTLEEVGKSYLNDLVSRSFFQQSSVYRTPVLLMHDLVHDLAMRISGEFCCTLDGFTSKTRHLSYQRSNEDIMKLHGLSKTKCLRTMLALPLSFDYGSTRLMDPILCELFQGVGGRLKVLSLSQSSIIELPDSIGDLKHLRYLDLSKTEVKKIPSSVCTLYNLQTLLLFDCRNLTQLPTDTCSLINLRHLVIRDTPLKEMPPQMCKLKDLQTLSDFVLGENDGSRIKELGELKSLQGSLHISGLENVVDVEDVLQADLKNKECLTELSLEWKHDSISDDLTKEKEVLTALKPHKRLKELVIDGYRGTMFPDWVACKSFTDMVKVSLDGCKNCCLLPPLGQLPSLKKLDIRYMDGLESIGDEFCGTPSTTPFPSLEKLHIESMGSLERWSFTGAEQAREIFPRLNTLCIESCDKLNVRLPAGCFPSLETFEIRRCTEMVSAILTSQADIDSAYPSLKSITLSNCPRLESFLGTGFPSNLKKLEISGCEMLIANRMKWDLQRLSSLRSLVLQRFEIEEVGDSFPEDGLLPFTLTFLSIFELKNLKTLNGKSFHNLTSLQELHISSCEELQCLPEEGLPLSLACLKIHSNPLLKCLPEEGLPLSLARLEIYGSPLLKQRCQRGTGEDWPKIQHIPKIIIDWKEI